MHLCILQIVHQHRTRILRHETRFPRMGSHVSSGRHLCRLRRISFYLREPLSVLQSSRDLSNTIPNMIASSTQTIHRDPHQRSTTRVRCADCEEWYQGPPQSQEVSDDIQGRLSCDARPRASIGMDCISPALSRTSFLARPFRLADRPPTIFIDASTQLHSHKTRVDHFSLCLLDLSYSCRDCDTFTAGLLS
jgi:hypothetical protein